MWSFKKNISVKSWYTLPIELSNDLYSKKIENEREYYRDIFQRYQQTLIEISEISEIVSTNNENRIHYLFCKTTISPAGAPLKAGVNGSSTNSTLSSAMPEILICCVPLCLTTFEFPTMTLFS